MFKIREEIVGGGDSQNAPIGKHNAHHAFDLITLAISATPAIPYKTAAVIASALLGRYPKSSSVARPR